ncbi:hypothetical protein FRC01_014745, partial [Tulasnella sp. 417]
GADVAILLGANWLTDEHMNAGGDWINAQLGQSSRKRVLNTHFLGSLAINRSQNPIWNPARPRQLDQLVRTGKVNFLMIPIYLHHHWAYLHVNIENRSCIYIDSLNPNQILTPDGILELLDWWLQTVKPLPFATGLSEEERDFEVDCQQDGHSCGVAVLSTMAQVALGHESWQQERADWYRMQWFLHLSEQFAGLPSHEGCVPIDPDPPTPPSAPFDFDPEDIWIPGFTAVVSSAVQCLKTPSILPVPAQDPSSQLLPSLSNNTDAPGNSFDETHEPKQSGCIPEIAVTASSMPSFKPGPVKGQSVLNFPVISRDEWYALEKIRAERRVAVLADALERAEQDYLCIQERKRQYERERKQLYRKRKFDDEIASGIRRPNGKKQKTNMAQLVGSLKTGLPALCHSAVVNASRPCREIREHDQHQSRAPCGRKRTKPAKPLQRMNWLNPIVFGHIDAVVREVGWPFSPTQIAKRLKARNPSLFSNFSAQRISDWRDPKFSDKVVWRQHVQNALAKGLVPKRKGGKAYILDNYPEVIKAIQHNVTEMRRVGVPLDLNTVHGIMIAIINRMAPELFQQETSKGKPFRCTTTFVRRFIKRKLRWSFRRATKAAQTTPKNAPELTRRAFLRMACTIRDEGIPAALIINADQTQVVLAQGTKVSYAETGAKQVDVVGQTEKRAFTLMVSVSQDGQALPFQAVYSGKDPRRSLPRAESPGHRELTAAGHRFDVSGTSSYWATQATMRSYITHVAAPYFKRRKGELGLPSSQRCLLYIDVWSVHRSNEFRSWIRKEYPWIIVQYCPGGCTSLFQPCDAAINRVAKEAIKRAALAEIVKETTYLLAKGTPAAAVVLDKTIGTLRDRTPSWLLAAWKAIDKSDLVLKSWEACTTGPFNLSYESLTSRPARQSILDLRTGDPEFYTQITSGAEEDLLAVGSEEDSPFLGDDSSENGELINFGVNEEEVDSDTSEEDYYESEDEIWPKDDQGSSLDTTAIPSPCPSRPVRACTTRSKPSYGDLAEADAPMDLDVRDDEYIEPESP